MTLTTKQNCFIKQTQTQKTMNNNKKFKTYVDKGVQLKKEGNLALAIEQLSRALLINPESILVLNHLAGIYKQLYFNQDRVALSHNNHLENTVNIYHKLIELNPNQAEIYFGMGLMLLSLSKWEEAIEYFIETLKRSPNWWVVYKSLAYALKQQGNVELKAISLCYEKSIIPRPVIRKIYNFKKQDLISSLKTSNDLKYLEVEQLEPQAIQKTEKSFVAILTNGKAWRGPINNPNDAVITSNNKLVKEFSAANSQLLFYTSKLNKPFEYNNGTVVYLQGIGNTNYYHWMLQVIPQICFLRRVGINIDTIEKVAFYTLPIRLPFQKQTMNLLGIPESKVIETFRNPYIKAKELIVTSPIKPGFGAARKLACDLVRTEFLSQKDKFLNNKSHETTYKSKLIYISRKNASYRRIINENELITLLDSFGFKAFCLESFSFLEQVDLFSQAEVVIAPHGAGLTNLLFSQPGIKVIEIFAPSYPGKCFQNLCGLYGLNHYSFIAEDVDNPLAILEKRDKHIYVNLNYLLNFMKFAEVI